MLAAVVTGREELEAIFERLRPEASIKDAGLSATFAEKWKFQSNTLS